MRENEKLSYSNRAGTEGIRIKAECEGEGLGKVLLFVRGMEQVGFQ